MLLGLALAVSTASGSFDVSAPGFWDRQYRIPDSTCFKTVYYVTTSAEDAADDLGKCGPISPLPQGPWEANCYLPPADADSLIRFLKAKRPILKYQERCAPADALPELDFKQSRLMREYAALGVSSAAFPSLAGFMDYQFQALERLIRARDRSTMTALTVLAVPHGSSGPQDAHVRNTFPRKHRPRGLNPHPWFPSKVPACGQVGHFALLFDEDAGPPGRKDVRAAALRLGPPYKEETCRSVVGSLATVIAKAPFKADKSLGSLPGLKYALPAAKSLPAGILADDEKFDGLSRDAQALGPRLAAAPTLRSLIDSELARLAPQAETLRTLRQGVLVKIDSGRRVPTDGAPVATAEPMVDDYENPDFWRKVYRIPDAYCTKQISVETTSFKTVAQAVSKCAARPAPDAVRWDAQCRLPRRDADALVDALKQNGRILAYHQHCNDADPIPELDYKFEHLKEEADQVGLAAAPWPGIRGLMEVTLGIITWLIEQRDRAALVRLNLSVVLPNRTHETEPRTRPAQREPQPANSLEGHPWWRMSLPVCEQVDYISAVFDAPPGSARERALLRAAQRLGTDFSEPNCHFLAGSRRRTAVFSRLPPTDIRSAMFGLEGLRSWGKASRNQSAQAIPDDLKLQALEKDLVSAGRSLDAAPHIRALVRSEVERLRPQAERLAELRGGTLVLFRAEGR